MKTIVLGGAGFLGRHIVEAFGRRGVVPVVPRRAQADLRVWTQTRDLFRDLKPDLVVHAAWTGGGIGFMRRHPGTIARDNLLMNTHVIEACREFEVSKFVGIGSVCSYPKYSKVPFVEAELWEGYPEETNAAYGLAKKMMLVQTQAYAEEFGLNGVHLLMVNLYGPWDNFDLESSHVIPGMIRRILRAKEDGAAAVEFWGDGSPTREFIFVEDAGEAVVAATERYDSPEPVNIGSGTEASIKELGSILCELLDYHGAIIWDSTKPNGQPRRRLDVSRAKERFGFEAKMPLKEGLERTVEWYLTTGRSIWER